jgi:DNA polymerase V
MTLQSATFARFLAPAAVDPPPCELPLGAASVALGFPSPSEDFLDDRIDLNQYLVSNAPATVYYVAEGWSMLHAGICDGDLLAVDRSLTPQHGDIVLAVWDGNQPACKYLHLCGDHVELHSANPDHPPIVFAAGADVEVFCIRGVVRRLPRARGPRVRSR